jgi:hypothetical protein
VTSIVSLRVILCSKCWLHYIPFSGCVMDIGEMAPQVASKVLTQTAESAVLGSHGRSS